jgi:hypothetical protein
MLRCHGYRGEKKTRVEVDRRKGSAHQGECVTAKRAPLINPLILT